MEDDTISNPDSCSALTEPSSRLGDDVATALPVIINILASCLARGVDDCYDALQTIRLLNNSCHLMVKVDTSALGLENIVRPHNSDHMVNTRALWVTHVLRRRWREANPIIRIPYDSLSEHERDYYTAIVKACRKAEHGKMKRLKRLHAMTDSLRSFRKR
jgi:hypothetical protein